MTETTAMTVRDRAELTRPLPLDQRTAAVYLAGLNTEASRRTMCQVLSTIARLVSEWPFLNWETLL